MAGYDPLVIEGALRGRRKMADSILRGASIDAMEAVKQWLRSVRLFLKERDPALADSEGWDSTVHRSVSAPIKKSPIRTAEK